MRTRAERRHKDIAKAIRKRKLAKHIYQSYSDSDWEYYNNLHQYSKNKIHCSCPLCAAKTRSRRRYGVKYNPPIRDLKRINKLNYSLSNEF